MNAEHALVGRWWTVGFNASDLLLFSLGQSVLSRISAISSTANTMRSIRDRLSCCMHKCLYTLPSRAGLCAAPVFQLHCPDRLSKSLAVEDQLAVWCLRQLPLKSTPLKSAIVTLMLGCLVLHQHQLEKNGFARTGPPPSSTCGIRLRSS